jgi:outer membrane protein assembly factor BamB
MNKLGSIVLLCLIALLSACGDEDNSEPPALLTNFTRTAYLDQQWSAISGDEIGQQFLFIQPLLLDDRILVAGRDGVLTMFDTEHGHELAEIDLDEALSGGIGGNSSKALVTTRDGSVVCIDLGDKKVIWKTRVPSEVLSRPVLYNNIVLVRTGDGGLLGLDLQTGKIKWSYAQAIPALTLRGSSTPVIARGRVFVGLDNGRMIALSPIDGEVIWDVALSVPQGRSEIQRLVDIDGRSVLYGRLLYATSYQGKMAAIDVGSGQFVWSRPFSSHSGVSVDETAVYSSDDMSYVWALDKNTGATLWKQEKLKLRDVTRPVLFGDYLVVGDYEGYLHVMSKFDGHFVARIQVNDYDNEDDSGILVPPVVQGERLYVITRNGLLACYTLKQIVKEDLDF